MMELNLTNYFLQHQHDAIPGELTDEIQTNAADLLPRVLALLAEFGDARGLRSGWRPAAVNAATPGAAAHSRHMTGQAVDVDDDDNALDAWITDTKLEQYGLAREHPDSTPSWCHLQNALPPSGRRTFFP
jgi:hypothetical protein